MMGDLSINAEKLLRPRDGDIERMCRHYDITLATMEEGMEHLKQWYKLQPHLPQGQLSDRKLIRHFGVCAFSLERTKKHIDSYFSGRHVIEEYSTKRDPLSKGIENIFKYVFVATLPQRTDENYRVTYLGLATPDASLFTIVDAFKVAFMVGEYRLVNDTTVGEHYIMTFNNCRMGHILQATPSFVTKTIFYLQSCMGSKIKGIHLVGLPSYAEAVVNLFKRAVSKKIADRFYTYSTMEELKEVFPAKMLPNNLGGDDISVEEIMANWKETLQSPQWRQWFIDQDNIRTDESKRNRTISNNSSDELLGIHGSFRKLELD